MIDELKESKKNKKTTLLQIVRYVYEVFFYQLTQEYVHTFTLCRNEMRLWVFDCSDLYSSTIFDIYKEPECFIYTITVYMMMINKELGLNNFIQRDNGNQFIIVVEDMISKEKRLQLKPVPIAHQQTIVCRGISCFYAKTPSSKDLQYIIKFFLVCDKWWLETDLLRLARKKEVEGVAKLFDHHRITSIADMYERLTFEKLYAFWNITLSSESVFLQFQSLLAQSFVWHFG